MTALQKGSRLSETGRNWAVLGGLAAASLLAVFLIIHKSGGSTMTPSVSLNQPAVQFVTYALEDDIQSALSGQQSVIGGIQDEDLLAWAKLDWRTTTREYEAAYDANEIAADNKFKDKKLLLSGSIASVEKDFTGQGYLTLRGSNPLLGVHAQLSEHSMAAAASMKKGQQISLVCDGAGRIATIAILDHCDPLNDYLNGISTSLESTVTQFLTGKIALSHSMARSITLFYITGVSMPANSRCMVGIRDACEPEMTNFLQDKTKAHSIQDRAKKLMESLKVTGG